jgi:hypothetical protein
VRERDRAFIGSHRAASPTMNDAISNAHGTDPALKDFGEKRLDVLQRRAFEYFLHQTHSITGLVADKSQPGSDASIAAVGFALACYPVGIERGLTAAGSRIARDSVHRAPKDSTNRGLVLVSEQTAENKFA